MKQVYKSGAVAAEPSADSVSSEGNPTEGDVAQNTPATVIGAYPFYQLFKELEAVVKDSVDGNGNPFVPDKTVLTQVRDALRAKYLAKTDAPDALPPGAILDYGGAAAPAGWLLCDGSRVSRATYASLFGAIGTAFGDGDGATTFGLPDFRRRVAVGAGGNGSATLGSDVGDSGGAETHTLTVAEMPAHDHEQAAGTLSSSAQLAQPANIGGLTGLSAGLDTASTGGGGAHNNMQPSLVVNKIIKT